MKKILFATLLTVVIGIGAISVWKYKDLTEKQVASIKTKKEEPTLKKPKTFTKEDVQNNQLAQKIDQYLKMKNRNHINVYVMNHQKEVINQSYGNLSLDESVPLKPEHMFLIGSCNKMITGIIVKQLEMEHKININAPVKSYIPEFRNNSITVKDLILHRSGLVYYNVPDKGYGLDSSVKSIISAGVDFKTKGTFFYNDANYIVLAKIIEKVTDESYEKNVNERIFKPYHLTQSAFFNDENLKSKFVYGFDFYKNHWIKSNVTNLDKFYGAGNVYMSTEALATLTHHLATNQIFDVNTTNQLMGNLAIDVAQKYRYGFYKEQGYYRTRGYMYGQDVVCYFNKNISIVLATNKIRFEETHINEADIKHIFEMVRMDNLNRNQTNHTTISPSLNKQAIL
ncbi:serine hydrolase [Macrococcus sp. DPC7161]|uniref:serine hydrolase domain-containing protein n=1 Tax=Macrococcus sp. DPC7161 TaxID=2507060 RepID=UPI00100BDBF0|nr:serine hydrolase domain-containing protein [Macrococcus sp. DPC7161]RXK18804.1 class A beta-lactamase-related serine hydrolase [Macrococcus sp. DPC7161]